MVRNVCHTVNNRVTHVHIRGCHINLCTKYLGSILIHAVFHVLKQLQILFDRTVSIRTFFSCLSQRTTILTDLLRCQIADECLSLFDQLNCCLIHLVKIIGGKKQAILKISAKPFHVCHDRLNELGLFFRWVCIIKTEIELSAVLFCQSIV